MASHGENGQPIKYDSGPSNKTLQLPFRIGLSIREAPGIKYFTGKIA